MRVEAITHSTGEQIPLLLDEEVKRQYTITYLARETAKKKCRKQKKQEKY